MNHINNLKQRFFLSLIAFSMVFGSGSLLASDGENKEFDLNDVIVHHLSDAPVFPLNFGGSKVYEGESAFNPKNESIFHDPDGKNYHYVGGFDMHITKRVTMMWIGCLILLGVFIPAANIISRDPMKVSGRFASAVEATVNYIRKDVVDANLHGHGRAYHHYMLSLFFFILIGNLMGLVPPVGEVLTLFSEEGHHHMLAKVWSGITTTGDVGVTLSLAVLTYILIMGTGFAYQGWKFIPYSVPNGVPYLLWPLMWPLEFIVSPLAKCFALTVRLLANMTAGHVVILALLGFIFKFQTFAIIPVSIVGAGLIYILEILVAFLQAYIFVLLTSIFVGSVMHRH